MTATRTPSTGARHEPGVPAFLLALCLVFFIRTVTLAFGGPGGAHYHVSWQFLLSDVALAAVVLSQLPALPTLWRTPSRHRCTLGAVAIALSLIPGWVVHPSARGNAAVLRWIAVAMIALGVSRLRDVGRSLVLATFAGVTILHVVVALAQRAVNGRLGIAAFGEAHPEIIGGRYASSGLTVHTYVFAAWCVVAGAILLAAVARSGRNVPLSVVAVIPFVGIGLTMSRAAALAVLLVLSAFAVAAVRQSHVRIVLGGAVLTSALGALINLSGWVSRTADSTGTNVTSGRVALLRQARELFREFPIFGVGPGRYVEALTARPELVILSTERPPRPVHLTPFLLIVEGGLVIVPALIFLGWAVLTQAWRTGAVGVAVALSLIPFWVLDHLAWSYPEGLLLTGLWLGTLDHLASPPDDADRPQPAED